MMRLELDAKNKILGDRYYSHHLVSESNYSKIFWATDLIINDIEQGVTVSISAPSAKL